LPAPLLVETFDGSAWAAIVPFSMRGVLPAFVPPLPGIADVPVVSAFHECNVRTYVTCKGVPGIWFFSLDATSPPAVWAARWLYHLPYAHAGIRVESAGSSTRYELDRAAQPHFPAARLSCEWRCGAALPPTRPGELLYFLTERLLLFSADRHGRIYRGNIWHKRWPLHAADVVRLDESLLAAAGIARPIDESPLVHYADRLRVLAWRLEECG
jgi:uncharacterized protein YqjF (DUF2071 family)